MGYGRTIAQAVSRWLPTVAARVRARVWSSGICGGQSGAGAGFLRVLRFPLPIFIPPNSPSSQSPRAGTIGHSVANMPSGPNWTPPSTMRKHGLLYNAPHNNRNACTSYEKQDTVLYKQTCLHSAKYP
jgi:hypothetical protein